MCAKTKRVGTRPATVADKSSLKNDFGTKRATVATKFFLQESLVQCVDRKHWNKAVALIENHKSKKPSDSCSRHGPDSRINPRKFHNRGRPIPLLLEMRQALLRHDWMTVHRLHNSLLDVFVSPWRLVCSKVMLLSLLSSPNSDWEIFAGFCRMAAGMDDSEMKIFLKTLKRTPNEIPRGHLKHVKGKLVVKSESSDCLPADAYWKASLPVRQEESKNVEMDISFENSCFL